MYAQTSETMLSLMHFYFIIYKTYIYVIAKN